MNLQIEGTIIAALEKKEGTTTAGKAWSNQDYVIEHESGQYPKRLAIANFNNKIEGLKVGDRIRATCNLDANEYQGKWFNKITFWKCEIIESCQQHAPVNQANGVGVDDEADLPF